MADHKMAKAEAIRQKDSLQATRIKDTRPSHGPEIYTGTFRNKVYGDISITMEAQQHFISYRGAKMKLQHFHYDQFFTEEPGTDKPSLRIAFNTDAKGNISSLWMRVFGDPVAEFTKQ
jgi:hypothetical protein